MLETIAAEYALGPKGHQTLAGGLAAGTALPATAVVVKELIRVHSGTKLRVRALLTLTAGTLAVKYLRPDGVTPYVGGQPATVPLVAGTEVSSDFTTGGEGIVEISITQSGGVAGSIGFVDVSVSR